MTTRLRPHSDRCSAGGKNETQESEDRDSDETLCKFRPPQHITLIPPLGSLNQRPALPVPGGEERLGPRQCPSSVDTACFIVVSRGDGSFDSKLLRLDRTRLRMTSGIYLIYHTIPYHTNPNLMGHHVSWDRDTMGEKSEHKKLIS